MPNIATVLKNEISRVARKEVRAETQTLKKAGSTYRAEIAALKRRAHALEQLVQRLSKTAAKKEAATEAAAAREVPAGRPTRFSAKSLASQRRRLGLTVAQLGAMLGASAQSIYNWEQGKMRPQAQHLSTIASLKTMGRKDVAARLESLQ